MKDLLFTNTLDLVRTGYFQINDHGKLELKPGIAETIIDCHTHMGWSYYLTRPINLFTKSETMHFFSEANAFRLDTYSADNVDNVNKKIARRETVRGVISSKGYSSTHTAVNLLDEMRRMNVSRSIILAIDILGTTRHTNATLNVAQRFRQFIPFVSLHPAVINKRKKLERYLKLGAKGIKVHPVIQTTRPTNPKCYTIYELAGRYNLPVFFHTGYSQLAPSITKKFVKKEDFLRVVKDFPEVQFVFGHSGINDFEYMAHIGATCTNVWLDLNGQPPSSVKTIISVMSDDRLLFGSDWPYYPIALSLVKTLIATERNKPARQKILHDNADRLLKLSRSY